MGQQRLTVEVVCLEATTLSYCIPLTVFVSHLPADPVKLRPKVRPELLLFFDSDSLANTRERA